MSCCAVIGYQDLKYREVLWILFPVLAVALGTLYYLQAPSSVFLLNIAFNLCLVSLILLLLWGYARFVAKKQFLNHSFGLGDLLFFYAFSISFPSYTFILLFVGAIFFSLLCFLILKSRLKYRTVPLAGLMSLFLFGIIACSLFVSYPSLYTI